MPLLRPRRRLALLAALALIALALAAVPRPPAQAAPAPAAAARKLSAITATDGAFLGVTVVGDRVVYRADYDVSERFDLYSAPLAGGPPVRLTGDLFDSTVAEYEVAPGGQIVFRAGPEYSSRRSLYSVPATGGSPIRLWPPADGSSDSWALGFEISPAGDRVAFLTNFSSPYGADLFSAPIGGGPAVRLSAPLPVLHPAYPGRVTNFSFAGDGQVVYRTVADVDTSIGTLYSVPAAGGPSLQLATGAEAGERVSPDGAWVVYRTFDGLRSVPFAGGASTPLDSGRPAQIAFTPDGARVIYALQGNGPSEATIKSVPVAGGAAATLTTEAIFSGGETFRLTPDGAGVLFINADGTALLRAPASGGAPQTFIAAPVNPYRVAFTDDGAHAIFVSGDIGAQALYSYPLAGGPGVRLDDPAASAGGFLAFDGVLAGGRAIFAASSAESGGLMRLYSVPLGGGPSTLIAGPFGARQELMFVRGVTADGTVLVTSGARAVQGLLRWRRLYAVPADGSAPARPIDQPRALVGDVADFALSPADGRAVYRADQQTDGLNELYSVPLAGGEPTRLSPAGQFVVSFKLSPAGGRVAFVTAPPGSNDVTLYSAPVDGSAPPALVGAAPPAGQWFKNYSFTPDGGRLLFQLGASSSPSTDVLFSAPAAGGPALQLAAAVIAFQVTPDSARALFHVEGPPAQLHSIPVGGGEPTPLGAIIRDGTYLITPDGARVIYVAPWFFGEAGALVSQPVAGGEQTTLIELADALGAPTTLLSADGAYILYGGLVPSGRPGAEPAAVIRRIPVAGGAAATLLSVPGDGWSLRFTQGAAGGPLIYHLSRSLPEFMVEHTLGCVPVGGGAPVALYGPADLGINTIPFEASADGAAVLFQTTSGSSRPLFRVGTAGGAAPVQVSGEGRVDSFSFGPGGEALFVEGDQLFVAPADGAPRRLDDLPAGSAIGRYAASGRSVAFIGVRYAVLLPPQVIGLAELYAADLAGAPAQPDVRVFLPLISR